MKHRTADLVVPVADLLKSPGATKPVARDAVLEPLAVSGSRVTDGAPVHVDLELQALNDGVVAVGRITAPWTGECRRCLRTVEGEVASEVREVYEREPVEGETRLLEDVIVDLTELARDAVLLELPLAPLCVEDCAGLCPVCGANRNDTTCTCVTETTDPRWAALDQLKFDQ